MPRRASKSAAATLENPCDQLLGVRDALFLKLQVRERVESAHQPEVEAHAAIERWIKWTARELDPHSALFAHGEERHFRLHHSEQNVDMLLAAILPDQTQAYLKASITKLYEHIGPGIAAEKKPRLLQELDAQIEALEVEEESLLRRIHTEGNYSVFRRREAKIHIVLDVQENGEYNVEIAAAIERESDMMIEKFVHLSNARVELIDKEKRIKSSRQSVQYNAQRHPDEYVTAEVDRLMRQLDRLKIRRVATENEMTELQLRRDAAVTLADRVRAYIDEQEKRLELTVMKTHPGVGEPAGPLVQISEHVGRTLGQRYDGLEGKTDWAK